MNTRRHSRARLGFLLGTGAILALGALVIAVGYPRQNSGFPSKDLRNGGKATRPVLALTYGIRADFDILRHHVEEADLIVTGMAGQIVREGLAPWDLPAVERSGFPATSQAFTVDTVVKGDTSIERIKVLQYGAVLNNVMHQYEGDPRLVDGRRYLLFLKGPDEESFKAGYITARVNGRIYSMGSLDNYRLVKGSQSVIMIEGGVTRAPYDEFQAAPEKPYQPRLSPPIYGRSEADLIQDIKLVLEDTKYPHGPWTTTFE